MRKAIREKCGDGAFIEDGNNRNKRFCYIGENPNPLAEMEHVAYKNGLQDYYRFCQDAAGFIPSSWLEYHLESTLDLFEINKKKNEKHQIIGSSVDRKHKNIEWLPYFYEWIRNKNVLRIAYHEGFQKEATTVIFHPHFIKEFNGRWHIFGHADGKEPHDGFNIPLDRISELPEVIKGVDYAEPKDVVYPDYFDDIVGVTHIEGAEQYDIVIRIHNRYMFGLVDTKPIHKSQETILPYDDRIGYGEVSIRVRPNNEFYGRVLQLGHDLEIVSPEACSGRNSKAYKRNVRTIR